MAIITLTTDMGLKDHYVAALKGAIVSVDNSLQIIDISHNVNPFSISQAAYFVRNCLDDFPKGTVHLIGVDAEPIVNFSSDDQSALPSVMEYKDQFIVATDNGVLSLILGHNEPTKIWSVDDVLSNPNLMKFPSKNILAPVACRIAKGDKVKDFCSPKENVKKTFGLSPVIEPNILKGSVSHIDHYGNIITNITRETFERMGKNIPFTIYFRRKEYFIDVISAGYSEVPAGEKVAIFNDNDNLEIAINKGVSGNGGGANSLFGLKNGDMIRIEFTPRGSKKTIESLF